MPELRHDGLSGTLVIVAPERSARPHTVRRADGAPPPSVEDCPFCSGNEDRTPPEVARTGTGLPDTRGWRVRVVPNLYPVVGDGMGGAHEVVVLSPAHDAPFERLDPAAATEVLAVLRDRSAHHLRSGRAHAQPFVNHGRAAGASIEHPHAQLVALDLVPPLVADSLERFGWAGSDPVLDAIAEAAERDCIVRGGSAADDVVAWCPPASPWAYQGRIASRGAGPRFDEASDVELSAVAAAVQDHLARVRAVLGDVAYNIVVNTAPAEEHRPYHWWVDVIPRTGVRAGFEQGTGMFVSPTVPEVVAATLRAVEPEGDRPVASAP